MSLPPVPEGHDGPVRPKVATQPADGSCYGHASGAAQEVDMQPDEVRYGQRVRVNVTGLGDHGQRGTIKKIRGNRCDVHLDWDQRLQHVVWFYAKDLDPVSEDPQPAR